ncbi:hypothetical protein RHECNPAF_520018 [Rhizobium etli CNPAF512]|nr:hypothetical protein RHECNPAF_520018 [Rhizobium etli CNPAF512]
MSVMAIPIAFHPIGLRYCTVSIFFLAWAHGFVHPMAARLVLVDKTGRLRAYALDAARRRPSDGQRRLSHVHCCLTFLNRLRL